MSVGRTEISAGRICFLMMVCFMVNHGLAQLTPAGSKRSLNQGTATEASNPQNGNVAPTYAIKWQMSAETLWFENEHLDPETKLPFLLIQMDAPAQATGATVALKNERWIEGSKTISTFNRTAIVNKALQGATATISTSAGNKKVIVEIFPMAINGGKLELLSGFDLDIKYEFGGQNSASRSSTWPESSVLATGSWLKVKTGADGVYKLTANELQKQGLNVVGLSSESIRVFTGHTGELAVVNNERSFTDLREMPIAMVDGGDGTFDAADYLLFYGRDQIDWSYTGSSFEHTINAYTDSVAYFITNQSSGTPLRIQSAPIVDGISTVVSDYDFLLAHEAELSNLIQSGREWFGEALGTTSFYDFVFQVPNVISSEQATLTGRFALRSVGIDGCGVRMALSGQSGLSDTVNIGLVPPGYAATFAKARSTSIKFNPKSSDFTTRITILNEANSAATGWVDFLRLHARRELRFFGTSMAFTDVNSVSPGAIAEYQIGTDGTELEVWDVSNPFSISRLTDKSASPSEFSFSAPADTLKSFLAFSPNGFLKPAFDGMVENQDLHALRNVEYMVVSHPAFLAQANDMADFHRDQDGYSTAVVSINQVFNEFSYGVQDVSAIKEFMRMLYKRAEAGGTKPRYLLLMGDASYDFKNKTTGNSNFIPAYQTIESLIPTASIISDDIYGLLDDAEGDKGSDLLDIAIGRMPARSKDEARIMVQKTLDYMQVKSAYGDWRNRLTLVADDEDNLAYKSQSETVAQKVETANSDINVQKIYLDAYKQTTGSGGQRYPAVRDAINEATRRGSLMVYYVGHGGELGWAHERVLEVPQINQWENQLKLPVFLTATCEFSRFDDPKRTSAGEYVFLNPNGGGVALLTTTRPVFSSPNFELTKAFTDIAFANANAISLRLGDIYMATKIANASSNSNSLNSRCFSLLGDPALNLAFPEQNIVITAVPDTMKALDKVRVKGQVVDKDSAVLTNFNGFVYPTIYDKPVQRQTLNNDGDGVFTYTERSNALFRGKATVVDGLFDFEFVVPKDIVREYGIGKISLYATSPETDASGSNFNFLVGGLSSNPVVDNNGPEIDLFMNDESFVFGGLTDENPSIYAVLADENGINMVGTGIGHDISAVLDGNATNTIRLNDYYEADADSYQKGKVVYPLSALAEGKHTLQLQAWDVANNNATAQTEFVVANSEELALEHVLNYPNPFTTNTDFYFEHNKPGVELQARIEIFTVGGKLVKTIDGVFDSNGYRVGPINWNGRDEYGDTIGKGVYVYKVKVEALTGERAEEYERLVILN